MLQRRRTHQMELSRACGFNFCMELCGECIDEGAPGLYLYALNPDKVTPGMLQGLKLITPESAPACTCGEADAKTMVPAQGITVDSPSKRFRLSGNRRLKDADPEVRALAEEEQASLKPRGASACPRVLDLA